jgi:two-component system chemotaxis sensor kinase CheA
MKDSKKDFIVEAEEILENVNTSLFELQNEFNPDTLNAVFRAIHTLKGLSGLFGLRAITDLSHNLESLLDDMRMGKIDLSDDSINFIFKNVDILKGLIADVSEEKEIRDMSDAIEEIEAFRKAAGSRAYEPSLEDIGISQSVLKVLSEYEEHRLKSNLKEGKGLYFIKAVYELGDFAPKLESLSSSVKNIGEVIATLPVSENVPEGSIGFNLLVGSSTGIEEIQSKAGSATVTVVVEPKVYTEKKPTTPPETRKEVSLKSTTNTVRVDIGKLDRILDTISELVLAKGAVVRIGKELAEAYGYMPLTLDVHKISQTLERKLSELQGYILDLRMVPFSNIYTRLVQTVRRYTREIKKEINVELFGEDTKIDKQLAEEIVDPLIHIIRNAIDHGIESKEERKSKGKKEKGTVTIKAFPEGNKVIVLVQDDGAGIDKDKVFKKALENGLIEKDHELGEKEIFNLIFLPGLSTKQEASEVSGRGVGMDIVKEKITSLGGFIEIESEEGIGTTFYLTLPITLAIIKALIIRVATEHFAIPLTSISETFFVNANDIQTIEGREVINRRGELLPLLRVADVFNFAQEKKDEYFSVVVGLGTRRLGLLVDDLLEQTEVVIRPLGEHLKDIMGLAGAAEVGRHEIVLVLDVEAMMEKAFTKARGVYTTRSLGSNE